MEKGGMEKGGMEKGVWRKCVEKGAWNDLLGGFKKFPPHKSKAGERPPRLDPVRPLLHRRRFPAPFCSGLVSLRSY